MHKHTIDWLRQINISHDAANAKKRWGTAKKVGENLSRSRVIELLKLFLFPGLENAFAKSFTDELIKLDTEFPVSDNRQELGLLAGLVMVSEFTEPSHEADAFALGIRAACFPADRIRAAQPEICAEAEAYLRDEANRQRNNEFDDNSDEVVKGLGKSEAAIGQAGDDAKKIEAEGAFRQSVISTVQSSHKSLALRIQQLSEESSYLWWVFNGYSDELQSAVADLTQEAYALPAASEAFSRTRLLPPPPSVRPLLHRAIRACKLGKEQLRLSDYMESTNAAWLSKQAKSIPSHDCREMVPISTAIEKTVELDSASALKHLAKFCPGFADGVPLSPGKAAEQYYNEIAFLKALTNVPK